MHEPSSAADARTIIRGMLDIVAERMTTARESQLDGALQFVVAGMHTPLDAHLCPAGERIVAVDGEHSCPATTLYLDERQALAIACKDLDVFDFRNPDHVKQIRMSGSEAAVRLFVQHYFGVRWNRATRRFESRDVQAEWDRAAAICAHREAIDTVPRLANPSSAELGRLLG